MISAYTGTQIREAEQPLLAAGMGAVLMQRAAHGLANAVVRGAAGPRPARSTAPASRCWPARATTAGTACSPPPSWRPGECVRRRYSPRDSAHPEALAAFERAGGRVHRLTDATRRRAGGRDGARRRRH